MARAALVLALSLLSVTASAQPAVLSVTPAPHTLTAAPSAPIETTFDTVLDAASVTAASVRVFGRWSGPATGMLAVEGATLRFVPDVPFFAGEAVTVALSKAVQAEDGTPLAHGYLRVFLNDGAGQYGSFTVHPLPDGSIPSTNDGADFDEDGRVAATLADGRFGAGEHTLPLPTGGLGSGAYVVRIEAETGAVSRTLTLTR